VRVHRILDSLDRLDERRVIAQQSVTHEAKRSGTSCAEGSLDGLVPEPAQVLRQQRSIVRQVFAYEMYGCPRKSDSFEYNALYLGRLSPIISNTSPP
jgi:hypothetical protein